MPKKSEVHFCQFSTKRKKNLFLCFFFSLVIFVEKFWRRRRRCWQVGRLDVVVESDVRWRRRCPLALASRLSSQWHLRERLWRVGDSKSQRIEESTNRYGVKWSPYLKTAFWYFRASESGNINSKLRLNTTKYFLKLSIQIGVHMLHVNTRQIKYF